MLDLVAIGQSSPGPIAVNTSILVGYQSAGVLGALCSITGTVLPPLIIITIISLFYEAFKSNIIINSALKGMQAGVAAVIFDAVYKMVLDIVKQKRLSQVIVMIIAFIVAYVFNINVALIIIIAALIGVIKK